jgi:hypothetical protein
MAAPPPASAVEDDDPLDAFMADITEQAKKPVAEPKVANKSSVSLFANHCF